MPIVMASASRPGGAYPGSPGEASASDTFVGVLFLSSYRSAVDHDDQVWSRVAGEAKSKRP